MKAQKKKGVREVTKGPNGEDMLTPVHKLKKKAELDTQVKRANGFSKFVKEKLAEPSLSSDQKVQIKDVQKQYNKLLEIATKQLTYISKDLAGATKT